MPTWHVYWECPASVLAGCALVGGLFVVLRLEHCHEHLRLSAHTAALQGEKEWSAQNFVLRLVWVFSPNTLSALGSLLRRICILSYITLTWLRESPRRLDECCQWHGELQVS